MRYSSAISPSLRPMHTIRRFLTGHSSVIRYLCVGVVNTVVGLGVIYLGIYGCHWGDVPANLLGYGVGIALSFVLNRTWTFASREAPVRQMFRFLAVMGVAYLLNLGLVLALIRAFGVGRSVAHAAGVIPYTVAGYAGSRWFAFRRPSGAVS